MVVEKISTFNSIVGRLLVFLYKNPRCNFAVASILHDYIRMTFFHDAAWPSPSPCSAARLAL